MSSLSFGKSKKSKEEEKKQKPSSRAKSTKSKGAEVIKSKGVSKKQKVAEINEQEIHFFNTNFLLDYMRIYSEVFKPLRIEFGLTPSQVVFKGLYEKVNYEQMIDIESVRKDPRFSKETILKINTIWNKGRSDRITERWVMTAEQILEIFQEYNLFLSKLSEDYRNVRTVLLKRLEILKQNFIGTIIIIRKNLLFNNEDLGDLGFISKPEEKKLSLKQLALKYNRLNKTQFFSSFYEEEEKKKEIIEEKLKEEEIKKEEEEKQKEALKKTSKLQKIKDQLNNKNSQLTDIISDENPNDNEYASMVKFVEKNRRNIQKEIAINKKVKIDEVTQEEIDQQIIENFNLPYVIALGEYFINNFVDFTKYPEINHLFIKNFNNLPKYYQSKFVSQIFMKYPLTTFPNGPNENIYNMFVKFLNELTIFFQEGLINLRTSNEELNNTVKNLSNTQLLDYKNIILSKLDKLEEDNLNLVLEKYSNILVNNENKQIVVLDQNSARKLLPRSFNKFNLAIMDNSSREALKKFLDIQNKLDDKILESNKRKTLSSEFADEDELDFISLDIDIGSLKTEQKELVENIKISMPDNTSFGLFLENEEDYDNLKEKTLLFLRQNLFGKIISVNSSDEDVIKLLDKYVLFLNNQYQAVVVKSEELKNALLEKWNELKDNLIKEKDEQFDISLDENDLLSAQKLLLQKRTTEENMLSVQELIKEATKFNIYIQDDELTPEKQQSLKQLDEKLERKEITEEEYNNLYNSYTVSILNKQTVLTKLKEQLDNGEINEEEYQDQINKIEQIIQSVKELNTIKSEKRWLKRRTEIKNYFEKELNSLLENLTPEDRSKVTEEKQNQVWKKMIEEKIITQDEIMRYSITDKKFNQANKRRIITKYNNLMRDMPSALYLILNEKIREMQSYFSKSQENPNVDQSAEYYTFVSQIIIARSRKDKSDKSFNIQELIASYPNLSQTYIEGILQLLSQSNIKGVDLIKYTQDFVTIKAKVLKNPLIKSGTRREQRYKKLFTDIMSQGRLSTVHKLIPDYIPPHVRECILHHITKPWLNIPEIDEYTYLVALRNGKSYQEMNDNERKYFNLPLQKTVEVVSIASKDYENLSEEEKKKEDYRILKSKIEQERIANRTLVLNVNGQNYYFYKPTQRFWIDHCQLNHIKGSSLSCDVDKLKYGYSLNNIEQLDKQKFVELVYRSPLEINNYFNKGAEKCVYLQYEKDVPEKLILISNDQNNYVKECKWFEEKYSAIDSLVTSLKVIKLNSLQDKQTEKLINDLRNNMKNSFRKVMSLLRLRFDMSQVTYSSKQDKDSLFSEENLTKSQGDKLEKAIYETKKEMSLYDYLFACQEIIYLLDSSKLFGNYLSFFPSLVVYSAEAYYPDILKNYPTLVDKLPEISFRKQDKDTIFFKSVQEELQRFIEMEIENILLQTIQTAESPRYDITRAIQLNSTKLKDINLYLPIDLGLKNICLNIKDFQDEREDNLIYYKQGDNIYCISKLELSNMALNKVYVYKGIEFDKDFVDSFENYTKYAVIEEKLNIDYIKSVTDSLIKNKKTSALYEELINIVLEQRREVNYDDLLERKFFENFRVFNINYKPVIEGVVNKINEIIREDINKRIYDIANNYINQEMKALQDLFKQTVSIITKKQEEVSLPIRLSKDEEEKTLQPLINNIVKYFQDNYPKYDMSRSTEDIFSLILRKNFYPNVLKKETKKCKRCKVEINDDETDQRNISTALLVIDKDSRIKEELADFCSIKCLSDNKEKEISKADIDYSIVEKEIENLLRPWNFEYDILLKMASFPKLYQIPVDPSQQAVFIQNIAKQKGVSFEQILQELKTLPGNENNLSIPVVDSTGKALSQQELWDRIKSSENFVIPNFVLLDYDDEFNTADRLESLQNLAKYFNILDPLKHLSYKEVSELVKREPYMLTNFFINLRKNSKFRSILKGVIKTFNTDDMNINKVYLNSNSPLYGLIQQLPISKPVDIFDNVKEFITNLINKIDKNEIDKLLTVPDNYQGFRDLVSFIFTQVKLFFPTLSLDLDEKTIIKINKFRNTLEYIFNIYERQILDGLPSSVFNNTIPFENKYMKLDEFYRMVNDTCVVSSKAGFKNTQEFIKGYMVNYLRKLPSYVSRYNLYNSFYNSFLNENNCLFINKAKESEGIIRFNLEKINTFIDNALENVLKEIYSLRTVGRVPLDKSLPQLKPISELQIKRNKPRRIRTGKDEEKPVDLSAIYKQLESLVSKPTEFILSDKESPQDLIKRLRLNIRNTLRGKQGIQAPPVVRPKEEIKEEKKEVKETVSLSDSIATDEEMDAYLNKELGILDIEEQPSEEVVEEVFDDETERNEYREDDFEEPGEYGV
jgi:hypothetical protein